MVIVVVKNFGGSSDSSGKDKLQILYIFKVITRGQRSVKFSTHAENLDDRRVHSNHDHMSYKMIPY